MKQIRLTKEQVDNINEVINVAVDVKNGDVKSAVQAAKTQTDQSVGTSVERNYVISGGELKEGVINLTKKQISETQLRKLMENTETLTVKQLRESLIKK